MCDQQSLRSACPYASRLHILKVFSYEQHLEILSLKGGCRGSSESTLVKMSNCWKSHALAQMLILIKSADANGLDPNDPDQAQYLDLNYLML